LGATHLLYYFGRNTLRPYWSVFFNFINKVLFWVQRIVVGRIILGATHLLLDVLFWAQRIAPLPVGVF
jgi:hypothetical protein